MKRCMKLALLMLLFVPFLLFFTVRAEAAPAITRIENYYSMGAGEISSTSSVTATGVVSYIGGRFSYSGLTVGQAYKINLSLVFQYPAYAPRNQFLQVMDGSRFVGSFSLWGYTSGVSTPSHSYYIRFVPVSSSGYLDMSFVQPFTDKGSVNADLILQENAS